MIVTPYLEIKIIRICFFRAFVLRWWHICQNKILIFWTDTVMMNWQTCTFKCDTYKDRWGIKCGNIDLVMYCTIWLCSEFSSWWRHQMETFSALLAICAGSSPVTYEFLAQRPVSQSFDVFFDLRPNKRLSKQSSGCWFETPSCPLWRHCNVMLRCCHINYGVHIKVMTVTYATVVTLAVHWWKYLLFQQTRKHKVVYTSGDKSLST